MDIENIPELLDYLRAGGRIEPGERPQCRVLAGGVSNRTVLVARASGEQWVLKQALGKLRVADDWFSPPERILREAAGMAALAAHRPARIDHPPAVHRRSELPACHGSGTRTPRKLENCSAFGTCRTQPCRAVRESSGGDSPRGRGPRNFRRQFEDRSYFESLRIEPYYITTAARVPAARAFLEELVEETRARRLTLVHGDYSPKNILIHDGRLVLLDHEVIHFGDPAFDIGFSMAHLLSKAHHVQDARPAFAAAAEHYWNIYTQSGGLAAEGPSVRHTLGCLLARVAGRSPLEYLNADERRRQQTAVVSLIEPPAAHRAGTYRKVS